YSGEEEQGGSHWRLPNALEPGAPGSGRSRLLSRQDDQGGRRHNRRARGHGEDPFVSCTQEALRARQAARDRQRLAMSDRDEEHDAIEALLPWYVTKRLDEVDRTRVEDALSSRPELRSSLRTIEEDRAETIALNEGLGAPR